MDLLSKCKKLLKTTQQRPDATALAPYEIWNRVGRRVNAGAHGIPTIGAAANGNQHKRGVGIHRNILRADARPLF